MQTFTENLYSEMQAKFHNLTIESYTDIQIVNRAIKIAKDFLGQLNDFIKTYEFNDKDEEVYYFKIIRPMFLKEYYYYRWLLNIELDKPCGQEKIKSYCEDQIAQFNSHLRENRAFYTYYITGEEYLDELFFAGKSKTCLWHIGMNWISTIAFPTFIVCKWETYKQPKA
jgi:hypothetical protein